MAVLAVILSLTAVLVAAATFGDKFFSNPERDDRWRLHLIGMFVKTEEILATLEPKEFGDRLATFLFLSVIVAIDVVAILFHTDLLALAERFYVWLFGPNWGHWFGRMYYYDYWISMVVKVPFFLILYATAFVLMLSAAYGVVLLVLGKILNVASSPKQSPLAFLIGIVGIVVAIGKLAMDGAKLLAGQ